MPPNGAAREKAVGQHDGERRGEEDGHAKPGGQKKPGAQVHEKVISSAAFQETCTASPG